MADIYRIGVAMTMTNGVSPILSVISRDLLHMHSQVNLVARGFTAWKAAIYGAGAAMAGTGILKMMGSMIEHASKLRHEQELLRIAFKDPIAGAAAVNGGTSAAWRATNSVQGTKVEDNMKAISDLHEVFGDIAIATRVMPDFQKMAMIMKMVSGGEQGNMGYLGARAMELRGSLIDPNTHTVNEKVFKEELDMMTKVVIGTRGRVSPREMVGFMMQAGPAARAMNSAELYSMWPAIIQALGGQKAGTALNSLSRMTLGGVITGRTASNLTDMGVLDPSKVTKGKFGNVSLQKGAFGDNYDAANPIKSILEKWLPAMEKKGMDKKSMTDVIQEVFRISNTSTTGRLLAEIIQNRDQIQKAAQVNTQSMGRDSAYDNLLKNDPTLAMIGFKAAWSNLLTALGTPTVGVAVQAMNAIANAMRAVTNYAVADPATIGIIVGAIGAIGAALVVLGGVAIVAAAASIVGAPIMAAIAIIAAAFGAWMGIRWGDAAKSQKMRAGGEGDVDAVELTGPQKALAYVRKFFSDLASIDAEAGASMGTWTTNFKRDMSTIASTLGLDTWSANFVKDMATIGRGIVEGVRLLGSGIADACNWAAGTINSAIGAIVAAIKAIGSSIAGAWTTPSKPGEKAPGYGPGNGAMGAAPMRYVPPASNSGGGAKTLHVNLDGQVLAKVALNHMVRDGNGPTQGAHVQDQTRSAMLNDFSDSNWA